MVQWSLILGPGGGWYQPVDLNSRFYILIFLHLALLGRMIFLYHSSAVVKLLNSVLCTAIRGLGTTTLMHVLKVCNT